MQPFDNTAQEVEVHAAHPLGVLASQCVERTVGENDGSAVQMEGGSLPGKPQGLGRLVAADRIRLAYDVVVQPSAGGLVEGGNGGDVRVIGLVHGTLRTA